MLFFLTLIFLAFLAFLTRYFERHCFDRLEAKLFLETPRTTAGEDFDLILSLTNRKRMILPLIRLRLELPKEIREPQGKTHQSAYRIESTTSLLSYQRCRKRIRLHCKQRGIMTIQGELIVSDFFGLTRQTLRFEPLRLIVHPAPQRDWKRPSINSGLLGEKQVRRWLHPDPIFYTQNRPYTWQDPMKDIDWKASARLRELRVKQHDTTADFKVLLCLLTENSGSLFAEDPDYLEAAASFLADVIRQCAKDQTAVGLLSNAVMKADFGSVLRTDSGTHHWLRCLDVLAALAPFKNASTLRTLQKMSGMLRQGDGCFLVTNHISDAILNTLAHLQANGITPVLILYTLPEAAVLPTNIRWIALERRNRDEE